MKTGNAIFLTFSFLVSTLAQAATSSSSLSDFSQSHLTWKLFAGANQSRISGELPGAGSLGSKVGMMGGFGVEGFIAETQGFSGEINILYSQRRFDAPDAGIGFGIDYLLAPLQLKFTAFDLISFGGGLYFGMAVGNLEVHRLDSNQSNQIDLENTHFNRDDFGALASLSFKIPVFQQLNVLADLRYSHGLIPIWENPNTKAKLYNRTLEAMMGIGF